MSNGNQQPFILGCYVVVEQILVSRFCLESVPHDIITPIVQKLVQILPSNEETQKSYAFDTYNFHYCTFEDGLKCVCVASQQSGIRKYYLFLLDVINRFRNQFSAKLTSSSFSHLSEMTSFSPTIANRIQFWNNELASPTSTAESITITNSTTTNVESTNEPSTQSTAELSLAPNINITEGWLEKKGNDVLGLWKRRYFVLLEYELQYYEDDTKNIIKGSIPFSTIKSIKSVSTLLNMTIDCGSRVFVLRAENAQTCRRWISALNHRRNQRNSLIEKDQNQQQQQQQAPNSPKGRSSNNSNMQNSKPRSSRVSSPTDEIAYIPPMYQQQ